MKRPNLSLSIGSIIIALVLLNKHLEIVALPDFIMGFFEGMSCSLMLLGIIVQRFGLRSCRDLRAKFSFRG